MFFELPSFNGSKLVMTASQRIVINTLASYGRTVFSIALGLFSSRWVLQALGPVDYGLMGVVGSVITFITFFNGVMAGSCARFFALSVGEGDIEKTNQWFNSALLIHIVIPLCLIMFGLPIGECVIRFFLNIPPERLLTSVWVFRLSLIAAFFSMVATPYLGMYTAKQHIYEVSFFALIYTLMHFTLSYSMTLYKGDPWMFFSIGVVVLSSVISFIQIVRAIYRFPECKLVWKYWGNTERIKKVFSFTGWMLFGTLGGLLRNQGSAIVLNKFFNPINYPQANASYSIGNIVSSQANTLSIALLAAFSPEITSREGQGNRNSMLLLANQASKFGTLLLCLVAVPLFVETEYILKIWLKVPPCYSSAFCRLALCVLLLDQITYGHMVAVAAVGKVAWYQITLGGIILLTLPLAWLILKAGYSPPSIIWAFIMTSAFATIGRVFWANYLIGAKPSLWIKDVLIPCATVICLTTLIGFFIKNIIKSESFSRLVLVSFISVLGWAILVWSFALNSLEKEYIRKIKQKIFKTVL